MISLKLGLLKKCVYVCVGMYVHMCGGDEKNIRSFECDGEESDTSAKN